MFGLTSASLLVMSILWRTVHATANNHCSDTTFSLKCRLDPVTRAYGTFLTEDQQWSRCVRKNCGSFPDVPNALVVGSPAFVGGIVMISCLPGYTLSGNSSVTCLASCSYDSIAPTCEPQRCSGASSANAQAVPAGLVQGQSQKVKCLTGFKASKSLPIFNEPCDTTITATCSSQGLVEFSDACVPVTCPPYAPTDLSLQCDNTASNCPTPGAIVGTMTPVSEIGFMSTVSKTCNAGYQLEEASAYFSTSLAECSATCQYTQNQRMCIPQTCVDFEVVGNGASASANVAYQQETLVECAPGFVFEALLAPADIWAKCSSRTTSTCNMVNTLPIISGTVLSVNGSTCVITGPNLSPLDGAYVGMRMTYGDKTLPIVAYHAASKVMSVKEIFAVSTGQTGFVISSVWSPSRLSLKCVEADFVCGKYLVAVGQYEPPDLNVLATPELESQPYQKNLIRLKCKDGYRATAEELEYNAYRAGQTEAEDILLREYTRTCLGCGWVGTFKCMPVECEPHVLDPTSEILPAETILYGTNLTVQCSPGYRATSTGIPAGKEGLNTAVETRTNYSRVCGIRDSDYDNDRVLLPSSYFCEVVSCGLFTPPQMSVVVSAYDSAVERIHTDPSLSLACMPGYQVDFTGSQVLGNPESELLLSVYQSFRAPGEISSDKTCLADFSVRCHDGGWMYGVANVPPFSTRAPKCVPIQCGSPTDECGAESCSPFVQLNLTSVDLSKIPAAVTSSQDVQTVSCKEGYRAKAFYDTSAAVCGDSETYERQCGFCFYTVFFSCRPVQCSFVGNPDPLNPISTNDVDPNGVVVEWAAGLMQTVEVFCNVGFRAHVTAGPTGQNPKSYTMTCTSDCSFQSQMSCQTVQCSVPNLPAAQVAGPTLIDHDTEVLYVCNAGFKRQGTFSTSAGPCSNEFPSKCVDGKTMYSSLTNPDVFNISTPPACVPITGCSSTKDDVCGSEGCPVLLVSDPYANVNASQPAAPHGMSVIVSCYPGYRAVSSGPASCTDPASYAVPCQYCNYESVTLSCTPVQCNNDMDPNGVPSQMITILQQSVAITCNAGYRAAAEAPASYSDLWWYAATCSDTCVSTSPLRCQLAQCNVPEPIPQLSSVMGSAGAMHGQSVIMMCDEGFEAAVTGVLSGSQCNATILAWCMDGTYKYTSMDGSELDGAICRRKKCPALDTSQYPNAIVPSLTAADYMYADGASSVSVLLKCRPGYRVGAGTSLYTELNEYTLDCRDCSWGGSQESCEIGVCPPIVQSALGGSTPASILSVEPNVEIFFEETVVITCAEGYGVGANAAVTTATVTCSDSGFPADTAGICKRASCGLFTPPTNSRIISLQGTLYGDAAQYKCFQGYHLNGEDCAAADYSVTCLANGQWSTPKTCDVILSNAACRYADVNSVQGSVTFGAIQTMTCKSGFASVTPGTEYAVCAPGLSNSYSVSCSNCATAALGQCVPLACAFIDWSAYDSNVETAMFEDIPLNGQKEIVCREGYRAGGHLTQCREENGGYCPPSAARSFFVQCMPRGSSLGSTDCGFSGMDVQPGTVSFCKRVTCGSFTPPSNSDVVDSRWINASHPRYFFEDTVHYKCFEGFRIAGADCLAEFDATCSADGNWVTQQCVPVTCPLPERAMGDGHVFTPSVGPIPYNSSIQISCAQGTVPTGSGTARPRCQGDCTLEDRTVCVPIICSLQSLPANSAASSTTATYPNTITISCDPGYVASGDFVAGRCVTRFYAQCGYDGSFDMSGGGCDVAFCPSIAENFVVPANSIINGAIDDPSITTPAPYGSSVPGSCNPGYVVNGTTSGDFQITCGVAPETVQACQWNKLETTCVIADECGAFAPWDDTVITLQQEGIVVGACTVAGKLPSTRGAGSCSKTWTARCVWKDDMWSWYYVNDGDLQVGMTWADLAAVLHNDNHPCTDSVTCNVATVWGTDIDFLGAAPSSLLPFGLQVRSRCREGFDRSPGILESTCNDTCSFSPPIVPCQVMTCSDLSLAFDLQSSVQIVASSASVPDEYRLDDAVFFECQNGYALSRDPSGMIVFDGELFTVILSQTFPPPLPTEDVTYVVSGAAGLSISFPAGSWPTEEMGHLKISVLLPVDQSNLYVAAQNLGGRLASYVILFQPSGIVFSQPIQINLPFDSSTDFGEYVLRVYVYKSRQWLIKPVAVGTVGVDTEARVVLAQTESFSLYAVVAVPPVVETTPADIPPEKVIATPPPDLQDKPPNPPPHPQDKPPVFVSISTPTPGSTGGGSKVNVGGAVGGTIAGILVLVLIGLFVRGYTLKKKGGQNEMRNQVKIESIPHPTESHSYQQPGEANPQAAGELSQQSWEVNLQPPSSQSPATPPSSLPIRIQRDAAQPVSADETVPSDSLPVFVPLREAYLGPTMVSSIPHALVTVPNEARERRGGNDAAEGQHTQHTGELRVSSHPDSWSTSRKQLAATPPPARALPSVPAHAQGLPRAAGATPSSSPAVADRRYADLGVMSVVAGWMRDGAGIGPESNGATTAEVLNNLQKEAEQAIKSHHRPLLPNPDPSDIDGHGHGAGRSAGGKLQLQMSKRGPGGVSTSAPTPKDVRSTILTPSPARDAQTPHTFVEKTSPMDALSVADVQSLLPPGWLCCRGCFQPVSLAWAKCPKCGILPGK